MKDIKQLDIIYFPKVNKIRTIVKSIRAGKEVLGIRIMEYSSSEFMPLNHIKIKWLTIKTLKFKELKND